MLDVGVEAYKQGAKDFEEGTFDEMEYKKALKDEIINNKKW